MRGNKLKIFELTRELASMSNHWKRADKERIKCIEQNGILTNNIEQMQNELRCFKDKARIRKSRKRFRGDLKQAVKEFKLGSRVYVSGHGSGVVIGKVVAEWHKPDTILTKTDDQYEIHIPVKMDKSKGDSFKLFDFGDVIRIKGVK